MLCILRIERYQSGCGVMNQKPNKDIASFDNTFSSIVLYYRACNMAVA